MDFRELLRDFADRYDLQRPSAIGDESDPSVLEIVQLAREEDLSRRAEAAQSPVQEEVAESGDVEAVEQSEAAVAQASASPVDDTSVGDAEGEEALLEESAQSDAGEVAAATSDPPPEAPVEPSADESHAGDPEVLSLEESSQPPPEARVPVDQVAGDAESLLIEQSSQPDALPAPVQDFVPDTLPFDFAQAVGHTYQINLPDVTIGAAEELEIPSFDDYVDTGKLVMEQIATIVNQQSDWSRY